MWRVMRYRNHDGSASVSDITSSRYEVEVLYCTVSVGIHMFFCVINVIEKRSNDVFHRIEHVCHSVDGWMA
jgi:hypothetical protein